MTTHRHRNSGGVYVTVLGACMLVTVIGVGALLAVRLQNQTAAAANDVIEARFYAQSAVEIAKQRLGANPTWRTTLAPGVWVNKAAIGRGQYSLEGADPVDGNFANNTTDPVQLTVTGYKGLARHKVQVTLVPSPQPLDLMRTGLHAAADIQVVAGKTLTVVGGPLSCNGTLRVDGTVVGNVEAVTRTGSGTITGQSTVPAGAKTMPLADALDYYRSQATNLPSTDTIENVVLTAGYNPYGPTTNAKGIYRLDTGGRDLRIRSSRISGTLIVEAPGKKVTIEDSAFLQPGQDDQPALLINGDAEVVLAGSGSPLSEIAIGENFNRAGAPFQGDEDADTVDEYPNEVRGLIHVTGTLKLTSGCQMRGVLVVGGAVTVVGNSTITWDPLVRQNVLQGYANNTLMKVLPGSWKRIVD